MDPFAWLMEGDPAIRWQALRDLADADPTEVAGERARVAAQGWGARILALQETDGRWGGGFYSPKWISTTYTLLLLRHFGLEPESPQARAARDRLAHGGATWSPNSAMGSGGRGFFDYLGETCVTGMNLALGCYFGAGNRTAEVVEHLIAGQKADGGWNCEVRSERSSFHTTISVLEGLLEFERSGRAPAQAVASARARGRAHEYLLERRLHRSLASGEVIKQSWTRFSFPPRWWFDVLRGLDYLRDAGVAPDERCDEAVDLVRRRRSNDGTWKLQNHYTGREHFRMEQPGSPSRWNTLRAMRVLRWAGNG